MMFIMYVWIMVEYCNQPNNSNFFEWIFLDSSIIIGISLKC